MSDLGSASRATALAVLLAVVPAGVARGQQEGSSPLPTHRLAFGAFEAEFDPAGSFWIEGEGWPRLAGSWRVEGDEVVLVLAAEAAPEGCGDAPARYRFRFEGERWRFERVGEDACMYRRMIVDRSSWRPAGTEEPIPARTIERTFVAQGIELPAAADAAGSWPSFRGPGASGVADGQDLPEGWSAESGEGVLWRRSVPGLAHSSPVVWGRSLFLTTAVSSEGEASFRPGLYGDGDASEDRSSHRFEVLALDKSTGAELWRVVAAEGAPIDRRHVKSTYANPSPATDGRIVVAAFGSQGIFAFDVEGRRLWSVDLGRMDLGAYDVPTYEWGPASSPILWRGLVILQADTQTDAFVLALDAESGSVVWKTDRDELPTWGTPTVVPASTGPELVTNGSNFIRAYDPRSGTELWRLGRSSKITAPTPIYDDGLIVVASGRAPERPLFVVRAGSRGDLTLPRGETSSDSVAWAVERRGPYMPTPIVYEGMLYVLNNNGVFDAWELGTGREIYRQRIAHGGSGFSASPVAADGRLYLPSEDGDVFVVRAGESFELVATNSLGEPLMATPALSEGVMYVRGQRTLFAIGRTEPARRR
ncbi:MAG: PQQ-binding-like beta-propeller repeat protein [Thermoanaerobaculia bacterium]|nr:PQQ-binding-like beta-propeller repeat protein [Thermoanaerobaculia bacterium]